MAGSSPASLPWDLRLSVALDTFRDLMEDGVFETRFPLHQVRGRVAGRGPALGAGLEAGALTMGHLCPGGGRAGEEMGPVEKHVPQAAH